MDIMDIMDANVRFKKVKASDNELACRGCALEFVGEGEVYCDFACPDDDLHNLVIDKVYLTVCDGDGEEEEDCVS